jgi:ABC-type nitrate/sulfonate/bicarbonate transport system substrate-binding protein
VASAGRTVDVSFGGLIEYLTKAEAINAGAQDPIKFIYPLYAFKGGALISFVKDVPNLTSRLDRAAVERFLGFRLGFPKFSSIHMLIAELVSRVGIPAREIKFTDVPFDDALLAAEGGSLDVVGAGLTQRAEALKRGGRVVASMESAGFADFGGFVVRGSTLERRRGDLENLIRIWFECVKYVLANLEENSKYTIAYLDAKSATKYSVGEFREALAAEFFPTSIAEARQEFLADSGSFPIRPIASSIAKFLTAEGILKGRSPPLELIDMEPHEIRK